MEPMARVWYRGWALEPEDVACAKVDKVLKETGTRRMIMGHTPDFEVSPMHCVIDCMMLNADAENCIEMQRQDHHH